MLDRWRGMNNGSWLNWPGASQWLFNLQGLSVKVEVIDNTSSGRKNRGIIAASRHNVVVYNRYNWSSPYTTALLV